MYNSKSEKRQLLVLSIDLGGKQDDILVHSNDTPLNLAREFCKKHDLGTVAESSISQYISLNLTKISESSTHLTSKTPQDSTKTSQNLTPKAKRLIRGKSNNLNNTTYLDTTPEENETDTDKKIIKELKKPGISLYYKALDNIKSKDEKNSKIIAERLANELNGVTFRPTINNTIRTRMNSKPEIDLLLRDKISKERIESKRLESSQTELKDCTFRPQLNKKSLKIDKVNSKDRNCYLYQNSRRKQEEIAAKIKQK